MVQDTVPGTQLDISISPLLKNLESAGQPAANADEIAAALALIFDNRLSSAECKSLLTILAHSGRDREALVLAACAKKMREAAAQVDREALRKAVRSRNLDEGSYRGGLCDIVGTGGDGHSTFNVSTASSILASSLLLLSKHGNRASTSTSGSADLLQSIPPRSPKLEAINSKTLPLMYQRSNYAFLFAPIFHPGMRHVAPIRKELGANKIRTIFNILGPLVNPVSADIEARIVGVAEKGLGPVFAEALMLNGATKGMVVCGAESLDEISCAGKTYCWRLTNEPISGRSLEDAEDGSMDKHYEAAHEEFELEPLDFGLSAHPLSDVAGGKSPQENAEILLKLLENKLPKDDPILDFVLINTAALFAISGICNAETSSMGFGDDGRVIKETGPGGLRWKEGVRRARWAIEGGQALSSLQKFIEISRSFVTMHE